MKIFELEIKDEIRVRRLEVIVGTHQRYQDRLGGRPITPIEKLEIVSSGLDVAGWKNDPAELEWIAEHPEKLLLLLELTHVYVDANSTLSSWSITPGVATDLLLKATEAVEVVYHNKAVQQGIKENREPFRGIAIEMCEDKAKLLRSAAIPFYRGSQRERLLEVATGIVGVGLQEETGQSDEKEGLSALLQIEEQLAISESGRLADWSIVERELPALVSIHGKNNPERLATILMQLSARDVEILVGSASLNRTVKEECREIRSVHPSYQEKYSVMNERGRRLLKFIKTELTPLLSVGMEEQKNTLYTTLLSWGEDSE